MHVHSFRVRSSIRWALWAVLATAVAGSAGFATRSWLAAPAVVPEGPSSGGPVISLLQDPANNPRLNPNWGTSGVSIRQIHAYQFMPIDSGTMYTWDGSTTMKYRTGGTAPWFEASLSLPSGVKLRALELYGCDTDATHDIYAWVHVMGSSGPAFYGGQLTTGTPGCDWYFYDLTSANLTVDNLMNGYGIEVRLSAANLGNKFREVNIYYQLQVSPPPGTPTFNDVPTSHPFYQYVEALAASGITSGCGGGNFCPDQPLTRGQMAVFLSRALGLSWPYQ